MMLIFILLIILRIPIIDIASHLKVMSKFPSFSSAKEGLQTGEPVILEEFEGVLKHFSKNKSLGPNGWHVELFITFLYLMGKYILEMAQRSRIEGFFSRAINSTFISLIPKCSEPEKFFYSKPNSLCNLVYKIISKIVSDRLRPNLVEVMTKEQFGFLTNRQILDDVDFTQEFLHSIK